MPARIRLQRHGKKGRPFYHIVVADGRAPRDGKFIERLGTYNPLTSPATIDLDIDKAVEWIKSGVQPSDTCRAILSFKGVMFKYHLLRGIEKGALTQEQADAKFEAWKNEKEAKINSKLNKGVEEINKDTRKRLEAEAKVREAKAAAIIAKNTPVVEVEESPVAEVEVDEVVAEVETPAQEETTQTEE
ncbi:MAG: 30S ribosomal protein S16 [Bacteroidota bacterium]